MISAMSDAISEFQFFGTAHAKTHGAHSLPSYSSIISITSLPLIPLKNITRGTPNAGFSALASACFTSNASPSVPLCIAAVSVLISTKSAPISSSVRRHSFVSSDVNPTKSVASGPNLASATPPGADSESASMGAKLLSSSIPLAARTPVRDVDERAHRRMRRRFPQSLVVVKFHRVVAVVAVVVAVVIAIVVAAYIPRCVVVSVVRWTLEFFDLFISFESRLAE